MNLALAFCSIRPMIYGIGMNDDREMEYLIALRQMERVLPSTYDWRILDNTVENLDQIKSLSLRDFLASKSVSFVEGNTGTRNKGIGELNMLSYAHTNGLFLDYSKVSYLGGRNIITCPYFFERSEKLEKSILVNNSPYLYFGEGVLDPPHPELFNTNAVTFKTQTLVDFIAYFLQPRVKSEMERMQIGVEQVLFHFIKEHCVSYEVIEWLGIIRNDWTRTHEVFNINNYHIM